MELQSNARSRCLHLLRGCLGNSGIGWIDEDGDDARGGDQLVQQLQPFRRYLPVRLGHACDVAARTVKAGDEAELHRVAGRFEDDRNGCGRSLWLRAPPEW